MNSFAILIDSTGDLGKDLRKQYDIDYCPMGISIDGKDYPASLDWDQGMTPHQLYDLMRQGMKFYTSQVPAQTFESKFKQYLDQGLDVYYIACSSGLSGSVNIARSVAAKLAPAYPHQKIVCFDSLISGYAQGAMAIKASEMRKEGKGLDEVAAWLDKNKLRYNQFGAIDDLTYLKRAGRVSASSAFFGNLFGVKPIVISDTKGHNYAYKKVKGRKASLIDIAQETVAATDDIEHSTIWIGHIDDPEGAEFVRQEILKLAKPGNIYVGPIGPIVGGSTGPGTVATYCFGKEVTVCGE
ncbi:MAG: Fatty acid-binding protein [Tenericutes bacterium ADurb.BinA155]|jgi:DegV family protein with EDD domain|nr:MAG: Fatty acid-binding protein [Tenericutes bacterium ADurb.BinA155]